MLQRLARASHPLVLRTSRGRFRALWAVVYAGLAHALAYALMRGESSAAYVRAGVGDVVFGLSDIDLAIVVPNRTARRRVVARWQRLYGRRPWLRDVFDVAVYDDAVLADAAAASTFTYDLGRAKPRAAYLGTAPLYDESSLRERPRLYGPTSDWRLLRGADRRPAVPTQTTQERRIAAWLELQTLWRYAFEACVDPTSPRKAHLCVKLVSEPARILLWLVHRERLDRRDAVLRRAIEVFPEEEHSFRDALALDAALPRRPVAPFEAFVPHLVRLSARIADRLVDEVQVDGTQRVLLVGGDAPVVVAGSGDVVLPLADWRAVVWPSLPDETFAPLAGDASDPQVLGEATRNGGESYPLLRQGDLLVLPSARGRSNLRAVQCRVTDPVTFALLDNDSCAEFPGSAGWCARDWAKRAVAEHRAWLRDGRDREQPTYREWPSFEARRAAASVRALGRLFTAARAALFLGSDASELALTAFAVAELLGEQETYEEYAAARRGETSASARTTDAFRERVLRLYAEPALSWGHR